MRERHDVTHTTTHRPGVHQPPTDPTPHRIHSSTSIPAIRGETKTGPSVARTAPRSRSSPKAPPRPGCARRYTAPRAASVPRTQARPPRAAATAAPLRTPPHVAEGSSLIRDRRSAAAAQLLARIPARPWPAVPGRLLAVPRAVARPCPLCLGRLSGLHAASGTAALDARRLSFTYRAVCSAPLAPPGRAPFVGASQRRPSPAPQPPPPPPPISPPTGRPLAPYALPPLPPALRCHHPPPPPPPPPTTSPARPARPGGASGAEGSRRSLEPVEPPASPWRAEAPGARPQWAATPRAPSMASLPRPSVAADPRIHSPVVYHSFVGG